MLPPTITLNIATVDYVLNRVGDKSTSSTYFLRDTANNRDIGLKVEHTIPAIGKYGESHLVRFDISQYDALGVFLRLDSAWTVMKTADAAQNDTDLEFANDCVAAFMALHQSNVLGREY